ncbi:hypothetical protein PR202_ga15900 [Eleusine coracana subsp. coracana]|uniref:Uncharacterized protein n=1 Tax=Eleusine coracana subsp. coracana TaxID=191504 RepID=A0AAV5CLE7_ELECO|nr:hypothetical protein PR202_ga15900 [Eleusine coracana subsp. coracana]
MIASRTRGHHGDSLDARPGYGATTAVAWSHVPAAEQRRWRPGGAPGHGAMTALKVLPAGIFACGKKPKSSKRDRKRESTG